MKLVALCLLLVFLIWPPEPVRAQSLEADREILQLVEHFVELTSQLRLYALEQYITTHANVVVARSTKAGFVNRVLTAEAWLSELEQGLVPVPFREELSNFEVFVESGALAVVRADFEILRDERPISTGVNVFTLVRLEGKWSIASIGYTSIPE